MGRAVKKIRVTSSLVKSIQTFFQYIQHNIYFYSLFIFSSGYENSSNLFSLINDNSEQNKNQVDRPDGKEFQELDKMLVDIQNQIERVRTNFEKFCRFVNPKKFGEFINYR